MNTTINTTNSLTSLDEVLAFSSELILLSLRDEKPEISKIKSVRKHCEVLSQEGIFPFDTNCDDFNLFLQIQEFATHVNG